MLETTENDLRISFTEHIHHTGDASMKFDNDVELLVSECPSYYMIFMDSETVFEDDKNVTRVGTMLRRDYAVLINEYEIAMDNLKTDLEELVG